MAAKPDHRDKLEDDGYICEVFIEEDWFPFEPQDIPPIVPPEPPVELTTLDPLRTDPLLILSDGNLTVTNEGSTERNTRSTTARDSGMCYYEVQVDSITANDGYGYCGMYPEAEDMAAGDYPGASQGWCVELQNWDDTTSYFTSNGGAWLTSDNTWLYEANMVVGVAVNLTTKQVWIRLSNGPLAGDWIGGGDPVLAVDPTLEYTDVGLMNVLTSIVLAEFTFNFGATPFVMPLPTGFTAWGDE